MKDCITTPANCLTPRVETCSEKYWIIGTCCGGIGIMVNPVERGNSGFCGCTDMTETSSGCPATADFDLNRGRAISILPCMTRSYCAKNWGGYGGICNPKKDHDLSMTYTSKSNQTNLLLSISLSYSYERST